jgi:hypothetical protein
VTSKETQADKRLRRTYGITLEEYNQRLAEQGGGCAICRHPPGKCRLSVDHDHKIARTKIRAYLEIGKSYWVADAIPYIMPVGGHKSKKEAVTYVKNKLRRRSVRGILCWRCNSGLQKYSDRPERFEAAAQYLKKFEAL